MECYFYCDAPGVLQIESKHHKSRRGARCEESLLFRFFFFLLSNEQIPDNLVSLNWNPGQYGPVIEI